MQGWFSIKHVVFIMLVWGLSGLALANNFDADEANSQLDQMTIELSVAEPTMGGFQQAITLLETLQEGAQVCINEANEEIQKNQAKLGEITEGQELSSANLYLFDNINQAKDKLDKCKIFMFRSQDVINRFSDAILDIKELEIFQRDAHIGLQIKILPELFHQARSAFDVKVFYQQFRTNVTPFDFGWILVIMAFVGWAIGARFKRAMASLLASFQESGMKNMGHTFAQVLHHHAYGIVLITALSIPLLIVGFMTDDLQSLFYISWVLIAYLIFTLMVGFFLNPPTPAKPFCQVSPEYGPTFTRRLKGVGFYCATVLIGFYLLRNQDISNEFIFLLRDVLITLLAVKVFLMLYTLNRMPKFMASHKTMRAVLSALLMLGLAVVLIAEWSGYHKFATHVLQGVLFTLVATFFAWLINHGIQSFLQSFNNHKYEWQEEFDEFLSIKRNETIPELFGLRVGLFILVWSSWVIVLTNIWNLAQGWSNRITETLGMPITVFNTDISFVPSKLIFGFIAFSIFMLIVRLIKAAIQKKVSTSQDRAKSEAYGAIFGYTGFTFSVLTSLVIAGFDLRGLAIIAGALSVGIGFGLQNIVNNFVSGLILLLERPIKPGDRISINNEEGFVKRVSIRSTCINTLENVDIIVPNSELITSQVVNQTFNNYRWWVVLKIGVHYDSDPELVKKVLLDVANEHPDVIDEVPNKPQVYFMEFGDSALLFELWACINNVNKKKYITTDLNSTVVHKFREHDIIIPYPQQDMYVKEWPQIPKGPDAPE